MSTFRLAFIKSVLQDLKDIGLKSHATHYSSTHSSNPGYVVSRGIYLTVFEGGGIRCYKIPREGFYMYILKEGGESVEVNKKSWRREILPQLKSTLKTSV